MKRDSEVPAFTLISVRGLLILNYKTDCNNTRAYYDDDYDNNNNNNNNNNNYYYYYYYY
jgi:hypothetical protein